MKKTISIIYIALFTASCCIPAAATLMFPSADTVGKEDAAKVPELISNGQINNNIGTEFDDYFTKSIPFRPQVITAQNALAAGLLRKESNDVITGSNGWLFTGESVDEYIGVRKSDRSIHNIAETIRIMQKSVTEQGANFVFTVAANKNEIYPEYMPAGYIKNEKNTLSVLEKYLKDDKINYVSLKDEMLKQKNNEIQLYLQTDTHWNGLGALYGYNAVMNGLGSEHESFSGTDYSVKNDWEGDIAKILYPSAPPKCSQYYFDIDVSKVRFMQPRTGQKNDELLKDLMSDKEENDTNIRTVNPGGKGSLYISRDSFSRAMLPYLITNYKSTYITRTRGFDLKDTAGKYNDIVYEMVERKLDSITDTVPMLYAPAVAAASGTEVRNDRNNIVQVKNDNGALKVYGILDQKNVNTESRIYIKVKDDKQESFYEAFPVTETELLNRTEKSDYGFSALIQNLGEQAGQVRISVIISK